MKTQFRARAAVASLLPVAGTASVLAFARAPALALTLGLGLTAAAQGQCHVQTVDDAVGHRTHMSQAFVASSPNYYAPAALYIKIYRRVGLELVNDGAVYLPPSETPQNGVVTVQTDGDWLVAADEFVGPGRFNLWRRIDGSWIHQQTITPPPAKSLVIGVNAALDGERLLVAGSGWAGIYQLDDGAWVFEAELVNPEPEALESFGYAVALSGDRAVVSAPLASANAGRVHVYERDGNTWPLTKTLGLDQPETPGPELGSQLGLGGEVIVAATIDGAHLFFGPDGAVKSITADDLPRGTTMGTFRSVAVNREGTRLLIGASSQSDPAGVNSGVGHLFTLQDGTPEYLDTLISPAAGDYGYMGTSVSLAGDFAVLGGLDGAFHLFAGVLGNDCTGSGQPDACDIYHGEAADTNGNLVPDECECPADLSGNEQVDVMDLLALLGAWGACPDPGPCPADLNADGVVDVMDLLGLLAGWGACP